MNLNYNRRGQVNKSPHCIAGCWSRGGQKRRTGRVQGKMEHVEQESRNFVKRGVSEKLVYILRFRMRHCAAIRLMNLTLCLLFFAFFQFFFFSVNFLRKKL